MLFLIILCVLRFVCVMKQDIWGVLIILLINENGLGFLSGSCSSNLLKFIDFLLILGGVPVLSLPIENFNFSIFFARLIEGPSPILPAGTDSLHLLISPLRKVPVVKTIHFDKIFLELSKTTPWTCLFLIIISSTDPSITERFS